MQILHRFHGSIQQYLQEISDPDRYRPDSCPQCRASSPLIAHGFYCRTLVDVAFDGFIRVRRYLCRLCKRTVSLLPEFVLPYLRFSILVISWFLVSRLLAGRSLREAARTASQPSMPYQRGQFWIRRFQKQATTLCAALASLTAVVPAMDFVIRALQMFEAIGWITAHRFLFGNLRMHLLGWPRFLIPHDCRLSLPATLASS
jgi:transposase-like protein